MLAKCSGAICIFIVILDTFLTLRVGGIEVHPMGIKVYQSALQEKISINGNGFKEGMTFNFEPDLKVRRYSDRPSVRLLASIQMSNFFFFV